MLSFSSSTALIVDGVPTLRGQGFDNPLLGVEQVEVLMGPQSTLYGRNAEAAVINITTRKPDNAPYAFVSAEAGNHERRAFRFDLSHPLVQDHLFLGVAGSFSRKDGFLDNTWLNRKDGGQRRRSGRLTLRWTPGTRTDAILRYTQNEYRDQASLWGSPSSPARTEVRSGTDGWNRSTARTWSLDVTHQFDSGIRLRSTTARNTYVDDLQQDTDFQPPDLIRIGRRHEFATLSQELRLEGETASGIRWLDGPAVRPLVPDRGRAPGNARTRFNMPSMNRQTRNHTQFSPKLALQYAVNPHTSLSQGHRAGGFNAFSPPIYREYEPEKVWALELGAKCTALDNTLRYSASLYAMNIRQMQVQQMGTPGQVFITNAATGRSIGAEFDIDYRLAPGWNLLAGLALNRSILREFQDGANNHDGNDNPYSTRVSGYASLRYQGHARLVCTSAAAWRQQYLSGSRQ